LQQADIGPCQREERRNSLGLLAVKHPQDVGFMKQVMVSFLQD